MSAREDTLAALSLASTAATATVAELQRRKAAAFAERNFKQFDRLVNASRAALNAEDKATRALMSTLTDPQAEEAVTLAGATERLEERLAGLREDAASLDDLTVAITVLTNAVLLIGLV